MRRTFQAVMMAIPEPPMWGVHWVVSQLPMRYEVLDGSMWTSMNVPLDLFTTRVLDWATSTSQRGRPYEGPP